MRQKDFSKLATGSFCAAQLILLTGCGGGGGGGDNGSALAALLAANQGQQADLAPVALKGTVFVTGPVADAVVCLDGNLNNRCDPGEPASGPTGADGVFSLSYTPADSAASQTLKNAPLLAEIASPNASLPALKTGIVMSSPAGVRTQVNPLTTLLQAGVAKGLRLEQAVSATATQLGLSGTDFYNYPASAGRSSTDPWADDPWTMALIAMETLQESAQRRVSEPLSVAQAIDLEAGSSDQLVQLNYTNPDNYYAQRFLSSGMVDPSTLSVSLVDRREGRTAGTATPVNDLYPQWRLTSTGWLRCDASAPFAATVGRPNRTSYCGDSSQSVGFSFLRDVAGQPIGDVVQQIRSGPGNSLGTLDPSTALSDPQARFPAGAQVRYRKVFDVVRHYYITPASDGTGFGTIESFIAGSPTSAVNLATAAGTRNLGLYDANSLVRFSVNAGNDIQYYRCDAPAPTNTPSTNCSVIGAGTWRFVSGLPQGVRMIEFLNVPQPTPAVASTIRYYAEFQGQVYNVRRAKPDAQSNVQAHERLNEVAWQALKTQLRVVSP